MRQQAGTSRESEVLLVSMEFLLLWIVVQAHRAWEGTKGAVGPWPVGKAVRADGRP